jgi:hypothetical protein
MTFLDPASSVIDCISAAAVEQQLSLTAAKADGGYSDDGGRKISFSFSLFGL